VARAVIQLAGALGLDAVAEGIESQEQADRLRALGYRLGQGFHLSRPLTPERLTEVLARRCEPADGAGLRVCRWTQRTTAPGRRGPWPTGWSAAALRRARQRPGDGPVIDTSWSGVRERAGGSTAGRPVSSRCRHRCAATSVLDVACARPDGPPVAIEVDRLDRPRTVDKLLAEAAAGRVAIWVRWGAGPFTPPPLPVHMVTRAAARTGGAWHTVADRPPPAHSASADREPPYEELCRGRHRMRGVRQ
jgi:hypothetical protein